MNKTPHNYTGHFYFMGLDFEVWEQDGELVSTLPGAPPGYEIRLEPAGDRSFKMLGGPADGAIATFHFSEDGQAASIQAAGIELKRVSTQELAALPIVERLEAPPFELTPEKEAAFRALYDQALEKADGSEIDYRLPYPKHEFVQYLIGQDDFIFHGSGNPDIEEFKPIRTSFELYDEEGRGNLQAVYGTHDGLWSMFFAVVDRGRLRGSIRNGVIYVHNRKGEKLALYNFSINQDQLDEKPYRAGMLYFLPRTTFTRLKMGGAAMSNEWASEEPVRPIARIRIEPEDFPFLTQIGGHDDGPLVRLEAMTDEILEAVQEAQEISPGHMRLVFQMEADFNTMLPEYVEMMADIMPGMEFSYAHGNPATLEIENIPPAYQQVLNAKLNSE